MKLIFTHENRLLVGNAKNQLEAAGFNCFIKNEFSAGAAGDLSPIDTWAELWVVDDADYAAAAAQLEQAQTQQVEEWRCPNCGEANDGAFEICWQCSIERPE